MSGLYMDHPEWTSEQRVAVMLVERMRFERDERQARAHNPFHAPAEAGETLEKIA